MKKLSLLLIILIIGTAGWFFSSVPKQVRLKDEDFPAPLPTEEQEAKEKAKEALRMNPNILVYYYPSDDTACKNPVPIHFEDLDKRVTYQEINALYALLTHTLPQNIKNAIISGTEINTFKISDGNAKIDLNVFLGIGKDPCGPQARKRQIVMTMRQFPTIKSVEVFSDGKLIP